MKDPIIAVLVGGTSAEREVSLGSGKAVAQAMTYSFPTEKLVVDADELPAGLERPQLGPIATGLGEVFHYLVTGDASLVERRTVQDRVIAPQLRSVPGVAEVILLSNSAQSP